jgi:hypothetical protein
MKKIKSNEKKEISLMDVYEHLIINGGVAKTSTMEVGEYVKISDTDDVTMVVVSPNGSSVPAHINDLGEYNIWRFQDEY